MATVPPVQHHALTGTLTSTPILINTTTMAPLVLCVAALQLVAPQAAALLLAPVRHHPPTVLIVMQISTPIPANTILRAILTLLPQHPPQTWELLLGLLWVAYCLYLLLLALSSSIKENRQAFNKYKA